MEKVFSVNNLDLIRLFAALQVAFFHAMGALYPEGNHGLGIQILRLFPGVPLFFFISGYLVSHSYERSGSLRRYAINKAVRIFPPLHAGVLFNLILIWSTGYFAIVHAELADILLLYAAKTSFLQFYNPDFMRSFGDGVLNGSLWTITVLLQFYIITPALYWLCVNEKMPRRTDLTLLAVAAVSLATNRLLLDHFHAEYSDTVIWKLIRVSFVPWLYMYIAGILAKRHWRCLAQFSRPRTALLALVSYMVYAYIITQVLHQPSGNFAGPLLFVPLALTIIIVAYTYPALAGRLLKRHDVSYGMYIYHMPVVNQLLHLGYIGPISVLFAMAASVSMATVSWLTIERMAIRLKSKASPSASPSLGSPL